MKGQRCRGKVSVENNSTWIWSLDLWPQILIIIFRVTVVIARVVIIITFRVIVMVTTVINCKTDSLFLIWKSRAKRWVQVKVLSNLTVKGPLDETINACKNAYACKKITYARYRSCSLWQSSVDYENTKNNSNKMMWSSVSLLENGELGYIKVTNNKQT